MESHPSEGKIVWTVDTISQTVMPMSNINESFQLQEKPNSKAKYINDLESFVDEKICELADHPDSEAKNLSG